jgi:hypothetical protein
MRVNTSELSNKSCWLIKEVMREEDMHHGDSLISFSSGPGNNVILLHLFYLPLYLLITTMTTKETFLQLGAGSAHHETAERIDFNALDEFVAMCIYSYITRRGKDVVKRELATDALSETTTLLTRIIDVGTVQFLSQNELISTMRKTTMNWR